MAEHVLVLGGGIIGLSCAFEAKERGFDVTLIEPGALGGQASGAAAGMLAPFSENPDRPDPFFQLGHVSLGLYPEWVARLEAISGIDAELHSTGSINIVFHEADLLPLRTRLDWQNRFGAGAELVDRTALAKLEPLLADDVAAGLYCPAESHVYAPRLIQALEAACRKTGVRLIAHAGPITGISCEADSVQVQAGNTGIAGDRMVVCAGAWTGMYEQWFGLPMPVHPIRGQICSYPLPSGGVRHMVFSNQAYWVAKGNGTFVCGASEDVAGFDNTVTEKGIGRLTRIGPRVFPFLQDLETTHRWAGLRPATRDGWPLLGGLPAHPRVIMAAGHYRNGILLSPVTASVTADLLEGRKPDLPLEPFAPNRFSFQAAARGSR
ncbi:glycine oxidase ThiO [Paenibacillus tarimensis]